VQITTAAGEALHAGHELLAFQRHDHRAERRVHWTSASGFEAESRSDPGYMLGPMPTAE
jgi:hypothetical protein